MKKINLNGTWQVRWYDSQRGDRADRLTGKGAVLDRAWDVQVPGEVHEDLIRLGLIPEPTVELNCLSSRWVEETFWHYRRTFEVPRLGVGERSWLVFEVLSLAAVIYLNGKEIGRHANYFYPCRLDVTEHLLEGENVLLVTVESGLVHAADKISRGLEMNPDATSQKRPWLRTVQSSHGWDWSPRLLNVGIPGSVSLEIARDLRVDTLVVLAKMGSDLQAGGVTARILVDGLSNSPLQGTLEISISGTELTRSIEVEVKPGPNRLEVSLDVPNPELWWPTGHGNQVLYTVTATLAVGEFKWESSRRIGFRHVRVNQNPHPAVGNYFIVEINGKPIFCKGGNFVPADIIFRRIDRERYQTLVDRALESNCNFLRVWGGGLYESDDFYEICNERGILVWQEFIFACNRYPGYDEAFYHDVKREATYQIRRLAHHPSLIIWCGNNEMEWAGVAWGWEKGVVAPDYVLFHRLFPTLLREEDGTHFYQPSSPYSPNNAFPNADEFGDQHPWSVGFQDNDFRKYRDMISRFPNEGGILGPNALPTVLACLPPSMQKPGSFAWELHDNSISYWGGDKPYPDTMLEQWLGLSIEQMGIADYVYWGGLLQGIGLGEYIKNFRRRMFDSAAAVFWMFNDAWPTTRSWTIVDFYLRRTPSFWPVKRAFAPLSVVVTREEAVVRIYGVNDGPTCMLELHYGLLALAGAYPLNQTALVKLPENASTLLAEFDAAQWDRLGTTSHIAFARLLDHGVEIARDTLILPLFKEMDWAEARIRVTQRDGKAIFESDTFAWRVCLDLDGENPIPDNFFDLFPGIPTVLDWPAHLVAPQVLRVANSSATLA